MIGSLLLEKVQCPRCKRDALLRRCPSCEGYGKRRYTVRGQWSRQALRKNPFLPYYASPPTRVVLEDCERCDGTGQIVHCLICGKFTGRGRRRLLP